MTTEQIEAEIATLQRQQEDQKKHWLRWGRASFVMGLILYGAVGLKMVLTGEDPSPPMEFIGLTFFFVGLAFATTSRPLSFARRRQ
ncbi:MAG TPA: hypothetical protein VGJ20_43290 [Xanthobacteraceae bacterium]|jgi:hypothetical protein